MKTEPRNQMADILHRATGNPATTLPNTAISNCFPGLEYDFRQFWKRAFVGLVFLEWDNLVIDIEDPKLNKWKGHRLFRIAGKDVIVPMKGPVIPGGDDDSLPSDPPIVVMMEWSNLLALIHHRQGQKVKCQFSAMPAPKAIPIPTEASQIVEVDLEIRKLLDGIVPAEETLRPGELTQGLCSPWQHDYRECACYYWPATRPDYVNVEPGPDGVSRGDNWMSKVRTGEYIQDDRRDSRMVSYTDLFREWEKMLRFQIRGRDAEEG
ncbi:MAG TPA: hypothetical protein VHE78_15970 [Gemmatimonadaceae bacterium]|nr:hypothetical protein [Gemmatimonadaceae bacterium]